MTARKLGSYLGDSSRLQEIFRHAKRLATLERTWKEIAPSPLAGATMVGALHQQTLVIFAANGAVAAKLRQLTPSLLGKFQERGVEVTAIRIEVQASPARTEAPKKKTASLGPRALENFAALEQSLENSPLKNALQRLLRRRRSADDQPPRHHEGAENKQENQGKSK